MPSQDQVAHAKPSLHPNGPKLRRVGPELGSSWAQVGANWLKLGASFRARTAEFDPSRPLVGPSRPASFLSVTFPGWRAVLVAKRLEYHWTICCRPPPCPPEYIPPPQSPLAPEHMRKRRKQSLDLPGKLSPHSCLSSRRSLEAGKNVTCQALSRCCPSTHIALKHAEASPKTSPRRAR